MIIGTREKKVKLRVKIEGKNSRVLYVTQLEAQQYLKMDNFARNQFIEDKLMDKED